MRKIVQGLDIEIISLKDKGIFIKDIDESGNVPLENARIKALAYYKAVKMPVFSCDSGLYLQGIPEKLQPGVHVRRVGGKVLGDEEMIEYYSDLALKFGGNIKAKYKNAICLVMSEDNILEYQGEDISGEEFILTSKPHKDRHKGFPLDSLSIDIKSGSYYMDIHNKNEDSTQEAGFRNFFLGIKKYEG